MGKTSYIHLSSNPSTCTGASSAGCCLENFFGSYPTIWGCYDPSGKKFTYDNTTGLIRGSGKCLSAGRIGGFATMESCNSVDSKQSWVTDWPPVKHLCKDLGCIPYQQGLPCQCNKDCHSWNNCCPDYDTVCEHSRR